MSDSVLKKFGKYFLLDRIGEGGMAEIFRARLATADGSGRLLVIKRILSANSTNPEFVQMFKSEVQVTMRFSHTNIVQLYEAGDEQGQQYIAMEFVDGRNLRQVLAKLSNKHQRFSPAIVCYLIEQTANGLHYAHTFKDRISGEPLNLVHRDVSPQNILLAFDGSVKVIDFGIAKAAVNGEATRAGVIKGKLSYLSPEQVMGDKLDPRSDVFALGIVAWELLTGKRLFVADGENEFQVLKMIESCNTFVKPPSTINREIPPELDQVVMQALARDPKKRFQTAEDLSRALRKIINTQYAEFAVSELSTYVKKLFQEHIVEDRKSLQHLNGRAEELIKLGSTTQQNDSRRPKEGERDHTRVAPFMGEKMNRSEVTSAEKIEAARIPQRQVKVSPQKPVTAPARRNTYVAPTPVVPEIDEGGGFFKVAMSIALVVGAAYGAYTYWQTSREQLQAQYKEVMKTGTAKEMEQFPANRIPHQQAINKQVTLRLNLFPAGGASDTRITINSQPIDATERKAIVSVGDLIELRVERPGFASLRQEFSIKEDEIGSSNEVIKSIKLDPMKYGKLSLDSIPSFADVRIIRIDQDGRTPSSSEVKGDALVLKTPFVGERLPAGNYRVIIRNDMLGMEKSLTLAIQEGKEVRPPDVQLDIKK